MSNTVDAFRRLGAVALFGIIGWLSGCAATRPMAFGPDPQSPQAATTQPVYLMTVTVKNPYRTYYLPTLNAVFVERGDGKGDGDKFSFRPDEPAKDEKNTDADGNRYLLRMPLDGSKPHRVMHVHFMAAKFPFVGQFFLPLLADLPAATPAVYYLGHVEASVRERKDTEFRAGPVIPLIDQAAAGASSGTWDVEITDRWASDEAMFKQRFPALATVEVRKAILPAFDRAKAQKLWEAQ